MEFADGVSMENVLNKGKPERVPPDMLADLFNNRLNKTQASSGAVPPTREQRRRSFHPRASSGATPSTHARAAAPLLPPTHKRVPA
eukprot:142078-Chlamydomonas_euryale.AAC.1